MEAEPSDRRLWPFLGSVVDYLAEQRSTPTSSSVPRNFALPFRLYSKANFRPLGGPYAGFLGSRYDPVWTEFTPRGTRPVPNPTGRADLFDPYGGVAPSDRFDLVGQPTFADDLSPQRIGMRPALLTQFDQARRAIDSSEAGARFDRQREQAYALLTSPRLAAALDIQREPLAVRERYSMALFGQSLLAVAD